MTKTEGWFQRLQLSFSLRCNRTEEGRFSTSYKGYGMIFELMWKFFISADSRKTKVFLSYILICRCRLNFVKSALHPNYLVKHSLKANISCE